MARLLGRGLSSSSHSAPRAWQGGLRTGRALPTWHRPRPADGSRSLTSNSEYLGPSAQWGPGPARWTWVGEHPAGAQCGVPAWPRTLPAAPASQAAREFLAFSASGYPSKKWVSVAEARILGFTPDLTAGFFPGSLALGAGVGRRTSASRSKRVIFLQRGLELSTQMPSPWGRPAGWCLG